MAREPFDVKKIVAKLEGGFEESIERLSLEILTNAVLATPVGDPKLWQDPERAPPGYVGGHARRNWQVGINEVDRKERAGVDAQGQTTIAKGAAEIELVTIDTNTVNITHSIPYAQRLNRGWSTQADPDYVEEVIRTAVASVSGNREVL